jgi:hypothetical protein
LGPRTRPNLREPPTVRLAELGDDERLASFRCSRGRWFQREVEEFINTELAGRLALETRVLLFDVGEDLVAVAAHQPGTLIITEDPGVVEAAHLVVVAITERLQSGRLADGTRLSDYVMRILLRDALRTRRTDVAFGIVAIENQRSLTMCERNGLTSQTVINSTYARATGRFAVA